MSDYLEMLKSRLNQNNICMSLDQIKFKPTSVLVIDIETSGHNDLPGDTPSYENHGVSGVALCNLHGDSVYCVINDTRDYHGIPVSDFIKYLNGLLRQARVVVSHHGVFDFSFLFSRGFDRKEFEKKRWIDTWLDSSIRLNGVFRANKLKDSVREKFQIETGTETAKDEFFAANNTKDYGNLPLALLSPYAQNDVRYTLMLAMCQEPLDDAQKENRDRYARNWLHLIDASARGVAVSVPLMKIMMADAEEKAGFARLDFQTELGSAQVNIDDEQQVLHYLHSLNLHTAPREMFGEVKYIWDREFTSLYLEKSKLLNAYSRYYENKLLITCLSVRAGDMRTRFWCDPASQDAGFHLGMHSSVFSRGGLVELKAPDISQKLMLTDSIRRLFVPRHDKTFVVCRADELERGIFLTRCGGPHLGADPAQTMATKTGLEPAACRILFDKLCKGFGMSLLAMRFQLAGVKFSQASRAHFQMSDKFELALPNLNLLTGWLDGQIEKTGGITDSYGRFTLMPQDKRWRKIAAWLSSVSGGFLSHCLDMFCRAASSPGLEAGLVLAHKNEFVFEVDHADADILVSTLSQISATHPKFQNRWTVRKSRSWCLEAINGEKQNV